MPGAVLGEAALYSGCGDDAQAHAVEPSRVCLLSRQAYNKRMEHARCAQSSCARHPGGPCWTWLAR
jgi:CRP-like cAMP-binding protein